MMTRIGTRRTLTFCIVLVVCIWYEPILQHINMEHPPDISNEYWTVPRCIGFEVLGHFYQFVSQWTSGRGIALSFLCPRVPAYL
jgi:hypothetical protein